MRRRDRDDDTLDTCPARYAEVGHLGDPCVYCGRESGGRPAWVVGEAERPAPLLFDTPQHDHATPKHRAPDTAVRWLLWSAVAVMWLIAGFIVGAYVVLFVT